MHLVSGTRSLLFLIRGFSGLHVRLSVYVGSYLTYLLLTLSQLRHILAWAERAHASIFECVGLCGEDADDCVAQLRTFRYVRVEEKHYLTRAM